jgi:DNA recombination protein RmuC
MGQLYPLLVPLLVGFIFGAATISVAAWRILRSRTEAATRKTNEAQIEAATLREQNTRVPELQESVKSGTREIQRLGEQTAELQSKLAVSQSDAQNQLQQNGKLYAEIEVLKGQVKQSDAEQAQLKVAVATVRTELEAERRQTPEKTAFLNDLANQILEDKSKRFTAQNQENLDQLLGPLKTKLQEFQQKVEDVYDKEGKDRTALATQVGHLMELNQQLSQDAHDLTHALKGSGKTQGDWGEMILERVLEMAGLRKGQEYEIRETYKREDGSRAQPDVVIHLPENKHIVVDSKVSVTAYTDYSSANSDSDKKAAIALHLDSVRRHIKELSEKNYHTLYDLNSLDFVIMFVPVEPAFMLAISEDGGLCESAWRKNVLLVSPTTFLFVVRTVAYLWRQEQATRSVREIAKRGADFYDKLVGFVTDLAGVGNRLRQASQSYESARNKLVEGQGNLIRQAEMLRELGVKPTKALPRDLVESALTEQPLVLPSLVAVADVEDFGEEPCAEDEIEPASDEDIPF